MYTHQACKDKILLETAYITPPLKTEIGPQIKEKLLSSWCHSKALVMPIDNLYKPLWITDSGFQLFDP